MKFWIWTLSALAVLSRAAPVAEEDEDGNQVIIDDGDYEPAEKLDVSFDDLNTIGMNNLTAGKTYITADNEIFEYEGVPLAKRQMGCGVNGNHIHYKVLKHNTYWSKFKQVTGCQYCHHDPEGGSTTFGNSWTKGSSVDGSIGVSGGKVIDLMASVGYSVTKSKTVMITNTCNCSPKHKSVCIYARNKMARAKIAKRNCPVNTCNGDIVWELCGKFSTQINRMPLKAKTAQQVSCEVGKRCHCK